MACRKIACLLRSAARPGAVLRGSEKRRCDFFLRRHARRLLRSVCKATITVWSWNIAAKSLQHLAPDFERKHPAVKVNVDMTGARMQTRLMLSLAAGVGAPDVSQFELTDAPRYIATGRLTDLTPVAAKYKTPVSGFAVGQLHLARARVCHPLGHRAMRGLLQARPVSAVRH